MRFKVHAVWQHLIMLDYSDLIFTYFTVIKDLSTKVCAKQPKRALKRGVESYIYNSCTVQTIFSFSELLKNCWHMWVAETIMTSQWKRTPGTEKRASGGFQLFVRCVGSHQQFQQSWNSTGLISGENFGNKDNKNICAEVVHWSWTEWSLQCLLCFLFMTSLLWTLFTGHAQEMVLFVCCHLHNLFRTFLTDLDLFIFGSKMRYPILLSASS